MPPPPKPAAPTDDLTACLRHTLHSMEALHTCLKMVPLPDALDPHMDACVALGKAYSEIQLLRGKHTAIRHAIFGIRPLPPKPAPAAPASQGRPPDYGKRSQAVEQLAQQLHRFTCPELAKHLGEERRDVKLVLMRKVKQGTVTKEGNIYTWVGTTPSMAEALS